MGFLQTTIEDVIEYKNNAEYSKLVKSVNSKNEQVSLTSMNALIELNIVGDPKELLLNTINNKSPIVNRRFRSFIAIKSDTFLPLVSEILIERKLKLNQYATTNLEKILFFYAEKAASVIETYFASFLFKDFFLFADRFLKDMDKSSYGITWVPQIKKLLNSKVPDIKFKAAEILREINDKESQPDWERLIEEKEISEKKLKFHWYEFPTDLGNEIPLVQFPCSLLDHEKSGAFSDLGYHYYCGMTDECLYIVPALIMTYATYYKYKLNIQNDIDSIERRGSEFHIHCNREVKFPAKKESLITKTLTYVLDKRSDTNEMLVDRMIEIFSQLKANRIKKRAIYEGFYDRENFRY